MATAILRLPAVKTRTGLSRSTIYERMAKGTFPQQISLGARAVGWVDQSIYRLDRAADRREPQGDLVSASYSDSRPFPGRSRFTGRKENAVEDMIAGTLPSRQTRATRHVAPRGLGWSCLAPNHCVKTPPRPRHAVYGPPRFRRYDDAAPFTRDRRVFLRPLSLDALGVGHG